ncbi:MAG: nucleotidyltransferase family protein [Propionibacteriaceae bacterium]|nr:nucleotidyltransferase family protein [Propionibacteriaceae bacterium]
MGDVRYGVVLGGGRSSRMGTDKLELVLDGQTLLQRTVAAALSCCHRVVVASPTRIGFDDPRVAFVLENPPFGGPAAGLAAAVAQLPREAAELLLLAGDLANPAATVAALLGGELGPDGLVLVDAEGWPQHLAGRYRLDAVRGALSGRESWRDQSLRRALRALNLARKTVPKSVTADLDTPENARKYGVIG